MSNLIGLKFGKLLVIEKDEDYIRPCDKKKRKKYKCLCDCGNFVSVLGSSLSRGVSKSCGCLRGKNLLTHGFSNKEKLYSTWKNMKQRCGNNKYYKKIKLCNEWNDYISFRTWAINNGYKDGLTIDRIDNDGNYEPSNCRWVDDFVQANNKSNNFYITYKNQTKTSHQWEKVVGIKSSTIKRRLKLGWSVERALTEKPYIGKNQHFKTPDKVAEMMSLWSSIDAEK